jgi:hypothetical protein
MLTYEQRLNTDPRWALDEGGRHFEGRSAVQQALERVCRRLSELQIPYAVVGGMALFHHGYRRFTEDVDLLVDAAGLERVHQELEGRGYLPPFPNSRSLRDTQLGVRIEFLMSGDFPGDGKPKPVSFPMPESASHEYDSIRYLNLSTLIELKLASGMTNPARLRDLGDVLELIRLLHLTREFGEDLDPYVREKYFELWRAARPRYALDWRAAWVDASGDLAEVRQRVDDAVSEGLRIETRNGRDYLVTDDEELARRWDLADSAD